LLGLSQSKGEQVITASIGGKTCNPMTRPKEKLTRPYKRKKKLANRYLLPGRGRGKGNNLFADGEKRQLFLLRRGEEGTKPERGLESAAGKEKRGGGSFTVIKPAARERKGAFR